MRIRPILWFLGLIGTLAALSIAVGSGRIIHAQVYGSPPVPPNTSQPPPNTVPPIQVNAVNPPAPTVETPPQTTTGTPVTVPPIQVIALNPPVTTAAAPPPTTGITVSGFPSTGVMSKVTQLVEQPLFELIVGVAILSALGIFFGWNAHTSRIQQPSVSASLLAASAAAPATMPAPRLRAAARPVAPRSAGQPLPSLTARLRPLGALREHAGS
jgi:hypothetical protein